MASENVVELFGKDVSWFDALFFNIYFNQNPSESVATSNVADCILIPILIYLTATAANLWKFCYVI